MNLLVTGGAGFIGSNFAKYAFAHMLKEGDKLVVFDKLTYAGNEKNLLEISSKPNYSFVQGDIVDAAALEKVIVENDIDTIVHFAAETHVDRSITGPDAFIETNIVGTYKLLEVLRNHMNVRLHHVSTDEVYGHLPLNMPNIKFNESTPYNPSSPYSASKAASDHLVRAYVSTYGLHATISNCSNNYGPYCFPEKLIPLAITRAICDEEIPVYGTGNQVRDWIHTFDHCHGIQLILEDGEIGETYMLGGNGERENIWIINEILRLLDKPKSLIVHVGDRKGHDPRYAVDFSKAKAELGYTPSKPIEEWIADTVEWYKENRAWWEPLKPAADKIAEKYLSKRL